MYSEWLTRADISIQAMMVDHESTGQFNPEGKTETCTLSARY